MGQAMSTDLFEQAEGLVTLASCGLEEKSYEYREKGQGAFTYFLSEGLKGTADQNGDVIITASEANVYTWDQTRRWAAGRGLQQTPKYVSAVQGEIALAGRRKYAAPTAKPEPPPKTGKPTLSVVSFRATGASEVGERFADDLTTALVKTKRFAVVERGRLEQAARERGIDPATLSSPHTAGEIGKALDVEIIVCGSLQASAARLSVTAQLVESLSGRISQQERLEGAASAATQLAEQLAAQIAAAYPLTGLVIQRQGEEVILDIGEEHGVTPGVALEIYREQKLETLVGVRTVPQTVGRAKVTVVGADTSRARLSDGAEAQVGDKIRSTPQAFGEVKLEATGDLQIVSVPSGAEVFLDGQKVGETPWESRMAARTYQIVLRKTGYAEHLGSIEVQPDARVTYPVELSSERGRLQVSSDPPLAAVILDGQFIGRTPLNLNDVPAGEHTVALELPGHRLWQTAVRVDPLEPARLEAALVGEQGSLRVTSEPAGAHVFIDGVERGQTPLTVSDLSPGSHTVRLAAAGYAERSDTVEVEPGGQAELSWRLSPSKVGLRLSVDRPDLTYRVGDRIVVSFSTTESCYVYLYDVSTSGTLFRLFPNNYAPTAEVVKGKTYRIPGEGYDDKVFLGVDGPAGEERFVALASPEPLDLDVTLEQHLSSLLARQRLEALLRGLPESATVEQLTITVIDR